MSEDRAVEVIAALLSKPRRVACAHPTNPCGWQGTSKRQSKRHLGDDDGAKGARARTGHHEVTAEVAADRAALRHDVAVLKATRLLAK